MNQNDTFIALVTRGKTPITTHVLLLHPVLILTSDTANVRACESSTNLGSFPLSRIPQEIHEEALS
jgi:hypothetical protein